MKKTTMLFVLFFFMSASFLKAECPNEIRMIGDLLYLFWENGAPDDNPEATITFPDGATFTSNPIQAPTWPEAIPYQIPAEYLGRDFLGEIEISVGKDESCLYDGGLLISCELSPACLTEIEDIATDVAEDVVAANECRFWDGGCGTTTGIRRTGRVGIGRSPLWQDSRLTLQGNVDLVADATGGWQNQIRFHQDNSSTRHLITDNHDNGRLLFRAGISSNTTAAKEIEFQASVGIGRGGNINMPLTIGGTDISHYRLYVEGGILTEEVRVRNDWADYVFQDDYDLKSLAEVEAFIDANGHLHNVPSADQVEEEGFEIGDMTKVQQEKIEELFLHMIEMEKRMKTLEAQNKQLKSKMTQLDK